MGPPPPALRLAPFYTRSIDAGGIPVSGSNAVPDKALRAARSIIDAMLARRPDLRRALVAEGQRVAIMGREEGTLDLPEQSDWKKPAIDDPRLTRCERKHYEERIGQRSDRDYWNARARGMGGLLTSAATENLLGEPGTRYYGENIFVHEFSHAILGAVRTADPALYQQVEAAYADAMQRGLWKGEYGSTTVDEYWAEGTQFWFESNKVVVIDGRQILSAADISAYDPALARVLRSVYGDRHHLKADIFWRHPARVPPGGPPTSTAEVC
ncbi:glycoside hydrolase [Sphingomonas sp. Leaf16]|nr:glycoside hydrolase [Sphingomonas sp. Leaf16]KQN08765.1 glycoside hydrolase [Sphingomonas sp. Leaf29]KQN17347.1 glycoside hydrolase [Sphingomonas sp. Leaf32]